MAIQTLTHMQRPEHYSRQPSVPMIGTVPIGCRAWRWQLRQQSNVRRRPKSRRRQPHGHLPSRCSSNSRWCCSSALMSAYSRVSSAMSRAFPHAMVTKAPTTIGTSATTTLSHVPTRYLCGVGTGCGAGGSALISRLGSMTTYFHPNPGRYTRHQYVPVAIGCDGRGSIPVGGSV